MTTLPDWALQTAIFSAMETAGVCGGRIYDRVPKNAAFPYVVIGESQPLDDGALDGECVGGWEIYHDIRLFSRPDSGSKKEIKTIAGAVITAVTGITEFEGHRVVVAALESARFFRDPDGLTENGALTFKFLLDVNG